MKQRETLGNEMSIEDFKKLHTFLYDTFLGMYAGFLGGLDGKKSACSMGDLGSIPGLGRCPRGGHGNPLQHSCLENPHGQRSLAGYSPWGCQELDTTDQLSTAQKAMHICRTVCMYQKHLIRPQSLTSG